MSCPPRTYDLNNFRRDHPALFPEFFIPCFAVECGLRRGDDISFCVEFSQADKSFSRDWTIICADISDEDLIRARNSLQNYDHLSRAAICLTAGVLYGELKFQLDEVTFHGSYADNHISDIYGNDLGVIEIGGTSSQYVSKIRAKKERQVANANANRKFIGLVAFGSQTSLVKVTK